MAIKNTAIKDYEVSCEKLYEILRGEDFSKLLQADFLEEAILPESHEFRFVRKTDWKRYGRNYFVDVKAKDENVSSVAVTVQSRKVTVLLDPLWEEEVKKIYAYLDVLVR